MREVAADHLRCGEGVQKRLGRKILLTDRKMSLPDQGNLLFFGKFFCNIVKKCRSAQLCRPFGGKEIFSEGLPHPLDTEGMARPLFGKAGADLFGKKVQILFCNTHKYSPRSLM